MNDLSTAPIPAEKLQVAPHAQPRAVSPVNFPYALVQSSVDEIYDLRAKIIRIGLLGALLYRPDPARETTAEERADLTKLLNNQVDVFSSVAALLRDGTPIAGVPDDISAWLHSCSHQNPEALNKILRMSALCEQVRTAVTESAPNQSQILGQHMKEARDGFHDAVVTLCGFVWQDYDFLRNEELCNARNAAKALSDRLTRLGKIGTHVRLVSLNASVEASRVGESGRGLSVIAQEFKALAEEIQQISQQAQGDLDQMTPSE